MRFDFLDEIAHNRGMAGIKGKSGIYERTNKGKENMSISHLGHTPWNKGRAIGSHTEKTKRKISEAMRGEKHWNWKGGITTYERKKFLNLRRHAMKLNAEGSHTQGEWELLKRQYGHICPACGKQEPEITLTEDHIIPLSRGGSDFIENIQPLCKSCNSRKHTDITRYERGFLQ